MRGLLRYLVNGTENIHRSGTSGQSDPGANILALGGGGRVAGLLRRAWQQIGAEPIDWQSRGDNASAPGLRFDPLAPGGAARLKNAMRGRRVVLALAGVTPATGKPLSDNTRLAMQVYRAACFAGVQHVFFISSAAVYGNPGSPHHEDDPLFPTGRYGRAKAAMEARISGLRGPVSHTILRIGNVVGADQLIGRSGVARSNTPARANVVLDRFSDGSSPLRSYIGPVTLARVFSRLIDLAEAGEPLPEVLNVAAPAPVYMADLLRAAGVDFANAAAPDTAIPIAVSDLTRLSEIYEFPLIVSDPEDMIREYKAISPEFPAFTSEPHRDLL